MEAGNSSGIDLEFPHIVDDESCWKSVPVLSEGLFSGKSDENIFMHPLIVLQLQLAIFIILASIIHLFLRRFYLPRLISEILAGLILGPTILGWLFPTVSELLFSRQSMKILYSLTRFGYLFFMFLIGVKMDASLIVKAGRREWTIGYLVLILPLIVITAIAKEISEKADHIAVHSMRMEWVAIFSGTLMLTSFPMVACFLMHLKIINSELGHLALSIALISDLTSVVIVNLDTYRKLANMASPRVAFKSMSLSIAVILFIVLVLRPLMYWMIRRTPQGKPVKDAFIYIIVIALLLVGIVGDAVGLLYMYGPFILGLVVPTGPPLATTLIEKLDTIVTGWMLPLMSTYCGLRSNLWDLNKRPPAFVVFVITVGFLGKILCGFLPAICFQMPYKDAAALALILTAKGIIELGVFGTNADKQAIFPQDFTMAVVVVLVFAVVVPVLTRNLYDPSRTYAGYQKRTVLNSSKHEALRVLACAQRQADALSAIRLLELTNPVKESPLLVFGLSLEELVGASTPLLLNHQLGQRASSDGSRWQPIVDVFTNFQSPNKKQTQVQVFTAISPPKLMHEDICWVAFDNSAALIVLPFHKKWNSKGKLISDSKDLRTLNARVLNKAPCSVGILIDRSRMPGPSALSKVSEYHVCVIYVGGKDDREALALARRMRGWPSVYLTIVRIIADNDSPEQGWESMLDNECLREMKHPTTSLGNVMYREELVKDATETCQLVSAIVEENYDLILVGRHSQTESAVIEGLSEWAELPELGPIGDQLASSDITLPVSVFVVQQQITERQ